MAEFLGIYGAWVSLGLVIGFVVFLLLAAPCHAVLLLPVAGLPLFWLLPLQYALPVNIAAWLATPFLYRAIRRAMSRPVSSDGFHSLVGSPAEVVSRSETVRPAGYLVQPNGEGELWSAYCPDNLNVGEWVKIVGTRGIGVVVAREREGSPPTAEERHERHCH